jgi:carbon monoxide dehydrogenase subunit G
VDPTPGAFERSRAGAERTVSATVTIPAPIERVWELANDPTRFAEWADQTIEVTRADRPLRIGSTYEERNTVLGPITVSSRWTVVEHDPPRRSTHRGEGLPLVASLDVVMELREVENATEVTQSIRYRPGLGSFGSLLDRVAGRRSAQAALDRSVAKLAAIAERELVGSAGLGAPDDQQAD